VKNGRRNGEGRVGVVGKEVEGVMKKRRKVSFVLGHYRNLGLCRVFNNLLSVFSAKSFFVECQKTHGKKTLGKEDSLPSVFFYTLQRPSLSSVKKKHSAKKISN
jgi:hypothetical protein